MSLKGAASPALPSFPPSQDASTSSAGQSQLTPPPELEQTLTMLTSHRSVLGYMLLTRSHPVTIIRHSGAVFEGEQGRKYASAVGRIVESVQRGLQEVSGDQMEVDDMRFMRIRTKRHEIMISPDERYLLAVLHDPAS
ncbi:uncharacterized protein LAESUDRAFT_724329 [Laetiporus sulphureus 93-53]|uniref:Roadblock/LAMTOR2 domain-containing protein n=1 Tax=Laetiporus sulphureus 93-53 TaxID=1314785 RepID=A0A165EVK8_9APHY|nr:uncharacterized protein LAESUDRAFT_724329 [Laetiporus sulphureus 93-53]KZT07856.1 hypothetical protein LAESUDRAFT_724329 [Laetiporus sulphureus 93-53]